MNKTNYAPAESVINEEAKTKRRVFSFLGEEGGVIPAMAALTVGLLFARHHLIFGAYPLGVALVCALPTLVWPSLIGVLVGSLTLGKDGVILAVSCALVVVIRIFTGHARDGKGVFSQSLMLRMSAAVIGGFVSAVYECVTEGLSAATILCSLTMILLTPLLTFVFSGLFSESISLITVLSGKGDLSLRGKDDKEKYDLVFFQCSALVTLFLLSLALSELTLFGIGADFIFISLATLLAAKKFGAPRAMAIGFVSALGSSGVCAVAFSLIGLVCGLLFPFGVGAALICAGAAASVWSVYSSGVGGLLTVLPEYAIAATIAAPMLKSITKTKDIRKGGTASDPSDLAGVFALSYRNKFSGSLDVLETSMYSISSILRSASPQSDTPTREELAAIVEEVADEVCHGCGELDFCQREDIFPAAKNKDKLTDILMTGAPISPADVNTSTEFCSIPEVVAEQINERVAELYQKKFRHKLLSTGADQYDLLSKLISEARLDDRREKAQDTDKSDKLTNALRKMGFEGVVAKVFGERKRKFIIAMEDEDGREITRKEILDAAEEICGVKTGAPEFFRKDKCALLECGTRPSYDVELAIRGSSGGGEISGDTALGFRADDRFYAICSDGMGSGGEAKRTSEFACKFLRSALGIGNPETALHLLNTTLRGRGGECSATIDIFALDTLDGSATFIKSGAAPSFVKRDTSIFRIKSATAPIGLMRSIDSERIRVEVKGGDYVIMLSDGVSEVAEESPWLLELLTKPPKESAASYAEYILAEARKYSKSRDDMSVIVMKILKLN